ncbi:MAG: hypothetical protein QOD60_843 [Solirubrobacterales bacterium]|jgi:hypothetical protein|nr:hypothetical protein [Solirubrobacterales bacterium]
MRDRLAVAVLTGALAVIAGCGSGGGSPSVPVQGLNVGQTIELADCTDWENSSTAQRLGTIRQLRNFAGGEVVGGGAHPASGTGAVIDDSKAYDLLDGYCKNELARGFKLYKLYERAAAFSGAPAG